METTKQEKCAGCAVREPFEHRCHGVECSCSNPLCMKAQGRITHSELMEIVNMGLENSELKKQATSQKQTIERLRGCIKKLLPHVSWTFKEDLKEAEQLLNTTEPN